MKIELDIIPGWHARNKKDIKRNVEDLDLGLRTQSFLLNPYPVITGYPVEQWTLIQYRNATNVESLFYKRDKFEVNLFTIDEDGHTDINYDIEQLLYIWSGDYIIGLELIEAVWVTGDDLIEYRYDPCKLYKIKDKNQLMIHLSMGTLNDKDTGLTAQEIEAVLEQCELVKYM